MNFKNKIERFSWNSGKPDYSKKELEVLEKDQKCGICRTSIFDLDDFPYIHDMIVYCEDCYKREITGSICQHCDETVPDDVGICSCGKAAGDADKHYVLPSYITGKKCCEADCCFPGTEKEPCWGNVEAVEEEKYTDEDGNEDWTWIHTCEGHIDLHYKESNKETDKGATPECY